MMSTPCRSITGDIEWEVWIGTEISQTTSWKPLTPFSLGSTRVNGKRKTADEGKKTRRQFILSTVKTMGD